ncbi:MAG: hypothetical protein PGN15_13020 [Aeromicrobium erythreum]
MTTTLKPTMPMIGFGKPNADAWGVLMTPPQLTKALRSQFRVLSVPAASAVSSLTLSIVRTIAAASPTTPATSMNHLGSRTSASPASLVSGVRSRSSCSTSLTPPIVVEGWSSGQHVLTRSRAPRTVSDTVGI